MAFPSPQFTCLADALNATIAFVAKSGIRLIKRVAVLAVRLGRISLELSGRRAVHVRGVCLSDKMVGVAAGRVVTSVTDLQSIRDHTVCELVCEAVSQHGPAAASSLAEVPIATGEAPSLPLPALIRPTLIYLRPKARLWRAYHLLGALVHERITMPLKTPVVHPAPSPLLCQLGTNLNGALHMSRLTHSAHRSN